MSKYQAPITEEVKINVIKIFLNLVDRQKLFNHNNFKLGYSCMPNVHSTIKGHNNTILNKAKPQELSSLT